MLRLQTIGKGHREPGHIFRVFAVTAGINDRIICVIIDVNDRRKDLINA